MIPKILLSVLLILIIVYTLYIVYKSEQKEAFENKYLNLQNVSGNKEMICIWTMPYYYD